MTMFIAYNAAHGATTVAMLGTSYTTGTKTAIQLSTPSTGQIRIVEWGVSFNGSAAGVPGVCELVQSGTATTGLTTHSTTTIQPIGDSTTASRLTMGTGATGYGAVAPQSATPDKTFDAQFVAPTSQYVKQWPLGREPVVIASKNCQLRINTAATLTAVAYIVYEEC
jgi:hypothetical protein